jgi:uncharacterized SAM-binding protein YcdF (DUF218 family)
MDLIHRKEVWVLTVQGWLLTCLFVIGLMLFIVTHIHSFLALNSPIKADILVVEGWIHDYAIKNAIAEFERGGYQKIVTTGLPIEKGYYLAPYKNFADLSATTLIELGFDPEKVVAVPTPDVVINRTTASAKALRQWIADSDLKIKAINIYTSDVHTRRSWLIFKQVLAPEIKVGAIPAKPLGYNPKRWWMSSEGVRSIVSEIIAYFYARFINWRT